VSFLAFNSKSNFNSNVPRIGSRKLTLIAHRQSRSRRVRRVRY